MNRMEIPLGSTGLGFLLILSFTAIALSAFVLTGRFPSQCALAADDINKMGYHPISVKPGKGKPWWGENNTRDTERMSKWRGKAGHDLSLPNIGLKDPEDIIWPYGEEFSYEAEIINPDVIPPDIARQIKLISQYESDRNGGKLNEEFSASDKHMAAVIGAEVEFGRLNKAKVVNLYIRGKGNHSGAGGSKMLELKFHFEHKDDKLLMKVDISEEMGPDLKPGIHEKEIDAPVDGFFYLTGSDNPAFTALLLSAVDLERGKPAKVWVFSGSPWLILGEEGDSISNLEPFLTYISISDLEICSDETKQWWEDTRKYFDGWKPPDDVRTIIFEGNTESFFPLFHESWTIGYKEWISDIYSDHGPFEIAYIDDGGRVIRVEQPGGFLCMSSELKDVGGDKAWWRKK